MMIELIRFVYEEAWSLVVKDDVWGPNDHCRKPGWYPEDNEYRVFLVTDAITHRLDRCSPITSDPNTDVTRLLPPIPLKYTKDARHAQNESSPLASCNCTSRHEDRGSDAAVLQV